MMGPYPPWPLTFIFPWPVLIVGFIGLATIAAAIGFGAWWVVSHLQWVW